MTEPGPDAVDSEIRLDLYTNGKLIQGSDPDGPIVKKFEHQVTGLSKGFPRELLDHCEPARFFNTWLGVQKLVDNDTFPEGAFLYRAIRVNGKFHGIFGRLQARSEGGVGKPGRKYSHFAALVFDLQDWRPGLSLLAYDLLFEPNRMKDFFVGGPDTSDDADRFQKPMIYIPTHVMELYVERNGLEQPANLWDVTATGPLAKVVPFDCEGECPVRTLVGEVEQTLNALKSTSIEPSLVPFAIGLQSGATGTGDDFALRIMRDPPFIRANAARLRQFDGENGMPSDDDVDAQGDILWQQPETVAPDEPQDLPTPPVVEPAPAPAPEPKPTRADPVLAADWEALAKAMTKRQQFDGGLIRQIEALTHRSLDAGEVAPMKAFLDGPVYTRLLKALDVSALNSAHAFRDWYNPDAPGDDIGTVGSLVERLREIGHYALFKTVQDNAPGAPVDPRQIIDLAFGVVNALRRGSTSVSEFRAALTLAVCLTFKLDARARVTIVQIMDEVSRRYLTVLSQLGDHGKRLPRAERRRMAEFTVSQRQASKNNIPPLDLSKPESLELPDGLGTVDEVQSELGQSITATISRFKHPEIVEIICRDLTSLNDMGILAPRFPVQKASRKAAGAGSAQRNQVVGQILGYVWSKSRNIFARRDKRPSATR